jgi:hypothetical protein
MTLRFFAGESLPLIGYLLGESIKSARHRNARNSDGLSYLPVPVNILDMVIEVATF